MTREQALDRISKQELDEKTLINEFEYIAHKLDYTTDEFQKIFEGENKTFMDYRNKRWLVNLGAKVLSLTGNEKRLMR